MFWKELQKLKTFGRNRLLDHFNVDRTAWFGSSLPEFDYERDVSEETAKDTATHPRHPTARLLVQ